MSLDRDQLAATATDLEDNMSRASLTPDELVAWLGVDRTELDDILAMRGDVSPVTVWLVRDAVEEALRADGDTGDWSVLTDAAREKALGWFPLRDVPTR